MCFLRTQSRVRRDCASLMIAGVHKQPRKIIPLINKKKRTIKNVGKMLQHGEKLVNIKCCELNQSWIQKAYVNLFFEQNS